MNEKLNELNEQFKHQVKLAKTLSMKVLAELKMLMDASESNEVTLSNNEVISKDDLMLFKEKLESIVDMKVSLTRIPTLCVDSYHKSLELYFDLELEIAKIADIKYDILLASLK